MNKKTIDGIKTIDDAIWLYAYSVAEENHDLRVEAHMKLCNMIGIAHTEFKPFESFMGGNIPGQKQAEAIIRREIENHKKKRIKKNGLWITPTPLKEDEFRCGCCQVAVKKDDARKHFDSTKHLKNVIGMSHRIIMHDLHIQNEIKRKEFGYGSMLCNIADRAEIELILRGEQV